MNKSINESGLAEFFAQLDAHIAHFDLLCHPFYRAWEAGALTRADLGAYAGAYYHQVAAFPTYLSALHARMEDGPARRAVLRNLCGEELQGRPHSELWLDFAEEMGADRDAVRQQAPPAEIATLIAGFRQRTRTGSPAEAIAAFYAYESQVPRIAETKARGLRQHYAASPRATEYFTLHATADVAHTAAWRRELATLLQTRPEQAEAALDAAAATAAQLWYVLDGIERERGSRSAAAATA